MRHESCRHAVDLDPGLAATGDDVALEAQHSIFLTETDADLRLVLAHATTGDIRLTVRESAPTTTRTSA